MTYCLADYIVSGELSSSNCYFKSDVNLMTWRGLREGMLTFIVYLYVYYVKFNDQNINTYINETLNRFYYNSLRIFRLNFQFTYSEGERLFRYWLL